jgi:NAD(P)H-nitrite reductase large subunit
LAKEGVIIHRNTALKGISGKNGKVTTALLSSGEILKTNLIAFAIGINPRKELGEASGLNIERGIKVNQYMETSTDSIYAAGDVAEVFDPDSGNWVLDSLWPIARQQGITAGINMSSHQEPYIRQSPINVTRLSGLTTTIIGQVGPPTSADECQIVRGESESWQLIPDAVICQNNFDLNRVRLMVGKKFLLGAILIGDQSLSRILEDLIINQVSIIPIRDQLLSQGPDLASILIKFWQGIKQHAY